MIIGPMIICDTLFCVKKKWNTPEYKVPPHFQWTEEEPNTASMKRHDWDHHQLRQKNVKQSIY